MTFKVRGSPLAGSCAAETDGWELHGAYVRDRVEETAAKRTKTRESTKPQLGGLNSIQFHNFQWGRDIIRYFLYFCRD